MTPESRIVNALSVDLEEYYHALVFQEATKGHRGGDLESRVEASTQRVLALLAAHEVKATFFIVGEIAAARPRMVRTITQAKHEVACHGYYHTLVSGQSRSEFRAGIRRAKAVLDDITGESIIGYRAPNFSIGQQQAWAYEILAEEGFRYDSSSYPILHDRYGDRKSPRFVHDVWKNGATQLVEFPVGTARIAGINLPIGGGGYFRLLPEQLIASGIRRVNTVEGKPVMFYFHNWELDPAQPRPPMAWRHRFRHYVGQHRMAGKLSRLLRSIRFGTARDVLGMVSHDRQRGEHRPEARNTTGPFQHHPPRGGRA
jgi:polysaccharide deacetylase family protein (PEP-CTERM system associated)